ncbi:MAG: hypothetical protein HZA02_07880 [Nitrospinae bacterium]|nr:hypothetical protein [Nitrospinota bacterium]
MKQFKSLIAILTLIVLAAGATGCAEEPPAEKQKVDYNRVTPWSKGLRR